MSNLHAVLGPNPVWKSRWATHLLAPSQRGRIAYDVRGGFGHWCVSSGLAPDYLFACAEFGTYGSVQALAGLRAENQSHHWGPPSAASTVRAKERLKELFCPAAQDWQSQVLDRSLELVGQAQRGLLGHAPADIGAVPPN